MADWAKVLLTLSVSGGVLTLLLLALRPLLRRTPTLRYYLCLVVLLRLILPFSPEGSLMQRLFDREPETVQTAAVPLDRNPVVDMPEANLPATTPVQTTQTQEDIGTMTPSEPQMPVAEPAVPFAWVREHGLLILSIIWAAGTLGVLLSAWVGLGAFARRMKRTARPARENEQARLAALCGKRRMPRLRRSIAVTAPVTMGLFRPCIVLPEREYDAAELDCILAHEYTHIRRRDIAYKWLALLVGAVHWFNPLVWLLRREIDRVCELSCDAAVARRMDPEQRTAYCRTLLRAAVPQAFSLPRVGLGGGKQDMKERMANIMTQGKASKWKRALGGLCAMAVCTAAVVLGAASLPKQAEAEEQTLENAISLDMAQADQNEVRKILEDWVEAYQKNTPETQLDRMTDRIREENPQGGALIGALLGQDYTLERCYIAGNGTVEGGVEVMLHYQLSDPEPSLFYATEHLGLTKELGEWKVSLDTCLDYTSVTGSEDLQSALAGFGEDETDGAITVPQMDETQMDAARKQAEAGDTCYTDRLTAGANFLHLIGGEAFEFGGEVYYIWPAGGMVRLDMAQVGDIWMVERVAINPLPFSPQDAQTLVAEGAPWEAEIIYEGLCPDADDIWYLFSVNDGEQRYEVCAANGMLRSYREERWVYPVTKERKIKHQHTDQPVAGTYAWEGLYYVSQYEAAPIPVMLVRDESDPTRLWYQYGEEGTLYPAQISGNIAYDEQNDITILYYQHAPAIWIQKNSGERDAQFAYPAWTEYYTKTDDMWSPQMQDVKKLLEAKLQTQHQNDDTFRLSDGDIIDIDGISYYRIQETSNSTNNTYAYSRVSGVFFRLSDGVLLYNADGAGYRPA